MTRRNREGRDVPLFTNLPNNAVAWLNTADAQTAFQTAVDAAQRSIADLNKEREVRLEDLHQPITL
ncbi:MULTISPECIES: hypothetical protein [Burkholderia]|uniref:hypothetical protein n=1 Tax=Burkholderia TaxID=32008 RepID=UPI0010508843|nr:MULTISPECIES: hypothetical protein [Burkholderia]MBR8070177.1 hypothetical protein [Burkholderia cenocepacia]TCW72855.1 hypothetical protein C5O79_02645 [Burkholderia sp. SRS-25]